MRIHTLFLFTTTFFIIQSCQKEPAFVQQVEEVNSTKSYENVDSELWSYWESFEEEAALRGVDIDLEALELVGIFVEIDQDHVAGSCTFSSNQPRVIRIDRTIWKDLPDRYREFIVFHELGHCVLFREHDESTDRQGNCLSIMRSGVDGCRDAYNEDTRGIYLDELFRKF